MFLCLISDLVFIVVKITYLPVLTHVLVVVTVTITRSVDSTTLLDYILLVYFVLIVIQRTWGTHSCQTLMTTPEANFNKVSIFMKKTFFPTPKFSLIKNPPFSQIPIPLACEIHLDEPHPHEDAMLVFIDKQFPKPWFLSQDLSDIWPYGRVFETTSGFHGEFIAPDNGRLSLIFLGQDQVQTLLTMKNIFQQALYIQSLKELY